MRDAYMYILCYGGVCLSARLALKGVNLFFVYDDDEGEGSGN